MDVFQLWGLEPMNGEEKARVVRTVERLLSVAPAAIITGQSEDKEFLSRLCDMAHAAGAKAYQWTPLFAEWDELGPYDSIRTAAGGPLPRLYGSEFNFRCPGSPRNLARFLETQDQAMAGCDFDGVFLDRVRYPSFSYGGLEQTACFCEDCLAMYRAGGVDAEALRAALASETRDCMRITGFREGRPLFADENVQRFFDLRAGVITRAVRTVAEHYAAQGRAVAADVFPPELAYLVGQSLPDLMRLCSFVKPMIYCYTQAPAGLPYERGAFDRATGLLAALDGLCGDLREQIRGCEEMASALGKRVYWGVESVFAPGIAEVKPEDIAATKDEIRAGGGEHFCMAWSVLVMPEENIDAWIAQ